ncbi:hypothetical protein Ddye_000354 [Dipteronia dyeriana]|uniref:HMA domain-containing protein n=1 Tax=Dipteronia dyeriana TaxID=168575 RepID=A0AAE0CSA1_9ROSI|nr:hypothetical protein Ddye_000354 [Dipteronia dyeriana]
MDIQGKITSFLHFLSVSVFWRFWYFISPLICKGCALLDAHKERILAMFFFVLETVSVVLDQIGKSKVGFLLAAFLLSVFGFALTLYSFIEARTNPTIKAELELKVVEIVFSLIQLIVTFIQFLKPKNNYNASAFPLAFAMIAVVFVFIKDRKITNSSPTDLLPLAIFQQPIGSMTSTPIELDQIVSSTSQAKPRSSTNQVKPGSSTIQVKPGSSTGKRPTNDHNKRVVMKLEINDDKDKKNAMETVLGFSGVDSISMEMKNNKLTMIGNIVPEDVVIELRKICQTELISVEPAKRPEEKKKSGEPQRIAEPVTAYQAYNPYLTRYNHFNKSD